MTAQWPYNAFSYNCENHISEMERIVKCIVQYSVRTPDKINPPFIRKRLTDEYNSKRYNHWTKVWPSTPIGA